MTEINYRRNGKKYSKRTRRRDNIRPDLELMIRGYWYDGMWDPKAKRWIKRHWRRVIRRKCKQFYNVSTYTCETASGPEPKD